MASTYPTSLDSLSTIHADGTGEVVHAATVNDLADAVNKIETELGTLPKGAASDVKTRIANTETVANAAIPKSTVTTAGDLIYATGSAAVTRLALGATGTVLKGGASAPSFAAVVNADVDAAAAIAYSKLNLAASIVNADISGSAAIAGSKLATGLSGPPGSQVAYAEVTTNQTTTQTVQASATQILSSGAVTYDGSTAVWVEFFCGSVYHSVANNVVVFDLWQDTTDMTLTRGVSPLTNQGPHVLLRKKVTPASGSHTFTIRMWLAAAGTGNADAGSGSAGGDPPMYIRITKA